MTKENKCKAVLLTIFCAWPGFLILANMNYSGWLLVTLYVMWVAATVSIGRYLLCGKLVRYAEGCSTPISSEYLEAIGFSYNNKYKRWQIGCLGAPCLVFYEDVSGDGIRNLMECYNFESMNEDHFVKVVHCMEEIRLVLSSCGITEGMIERAQEVWGR